VDRQTI